MKRKKISSALNLSIVVMEILALLMALAETGRIGIEWYTEESNILALFSSLFFVGYIVSGKKKLPAFLKWLKYTSTLGLTVTFLVTIFVLGPMYNFNYAWLLFHNNLIFHHLLCPIVAFISFIYFDEVGKIEKKDTRLSIIWTLGYAALMIVLNIVGVVDGPYPFLRVMSQPVLVSAFWFVAIVGMAYLLSIGIRKIKR
ncbi:hypothetical protein J6X90_03215 [Candidatus Saccharibacteria bacterium]|nr:hypothetical protein [Candidatus Saccharibacteria bacterium]